MQYDENAEKYGYEGEMTPLKCDELKAYKADVTIPVYGTIADAKVYLKKEVDAAIAELKAQVNAHNNRANLWLYNAQNEHNATVAVRMALYAQIPLEEYESIKRENKRLKDVLKRHGITLLKED